MLRLASRAAFKRLGVLLCVLLLLCVAAWYIMIRMPGRSYGGAPPEERPGLADELRRDVTKLAGAIGERNLWRAAAYARATAWLETSLQEAGYTVARQVYEVRGAESVNLEVERKGNGEIVIVGAHYDSVRGSPGANDNGSGVAGTLALARTWAGRTPRRTLRFVFFANEEPPFFQTDEMGSVVYAKRCKERGENIVAMVSLETIGYFSDEEGS